MYWVPTLVFLAHVAEEWRGFPAWATRHFGVTSRAWYVYSHIVLIVAMVAISARAETATAWRFAATGMQWTLGTNALFHLATTALFREYSPGAVTGTLLFLPATAWLFARSHSLGLLTDTQLVAAAGLGTIVGALVVASLWLPMDLDWRLRMRARG